LPSRSNRSTECVNSGKPIRPRCVNDSRMAPSRRSKPPCNKAPHQMFTDSATPQACVLLALSKTELKGK
jgi:hypothetical protein